MNVTIKLLTIVCLMSAGGTAWARHAERGRFEIDRGDGRKGDDKHEGHEGGYGAPEPVTMVGLALGAGAAGLAAWRVRRKRS
jgi:hypothetical protein